MTVERGARLHPARRRHGRRDQDGPARGRRAQPAHRQGLRRADQQHQPRRRHATPAPDEANPRNGNKHGHILEITEDGGDHTARDVHLVAADRLRRPGRPVDLLRRVRQDQGQSPISCPDNVAFDRAGNLWISTDGNALGSNDGLFAVAARGPRARATSSSSSPCRSAPRPAARSSPATTGRCSSRCSTPARSPAPPSRTRRRPGPTATSPSPASSVTWRLDGGPIGT